MNWGQLNTITTFRPEQYQLQTELRTRGIDSELEFKILRELWRCQICTGVHSNLEEMMVHRTYKHSDIPFTNAVLEQMYFQYDLHLLKLYEKFLVELDGGIHKKKGVMRHDEEKENFADSQHYTVLRYSSKKKPYKIADEIVKEVQK
jgi:hypothetical protein